MANITPPLEVLMWLGQPRSPDSKVARYITIPQDPAVVVHLTGIRRYRELKPRTLA